MTTVTAPRSAAARTTRTARRKEATSRFRRVSEIVLVTGTVLGVAAAFGPGWAVRAGVGVAVVAAVVACAFAWRELFVVRRQHARAMLEATVEHGRRLSEERARSGAVIETLRRRLSDAAELLDQQRVIIAELTLKIAGLRGDRAHLRHEVDHREVVIESLRETVRARESELEALRVAEPDAEVHSLPRRMRTEPESEWDALGAGNRWADGSHPTVVDLATLDTAMVLPNYEADRQVG